MVTIKGGLAIPTGSETDLFDHAAGDQKTRSPAPPGAAKVMYKRAPFWLRFLIYFAIGFNLPKLIKLLPTSSAETKRMSSEIIRLRKDVASLQSQVNTLKSNVAVLEWKRSPKSISELYRGSLSHTENH